jgi:hypothetical protein
MRAWRSDSGARTASSLRTPRRSFLLVLLAFLIAGLSPAPAALAAPARTHTPARPAADTTSDESGFRVRVSETKSGTHAPALPPKPDAVDAPDVPVPPDVPEPPDAGNNDDNGENDLVRFGEDITIPADKVVEGNVVAIGGNVTVLGRVKGDVTSVGGTVEVKGKGVVEGDAVSLGGGVNTTDSASVAGSNVSIGSHRFWHGWGMMPMLGLMGVVGFGTWLIGTLVKLLLMIFFAWIALLLWKDGITRAANKLRDQFGKSFLWGLLTMAGLVVAIPVGIISLVLLAAIAVVILCITIIGIPVAVLLVIALVLAIIGLIVGAIFLFFLGYVNGLLYLGRRVLGERGRDRSPLFAIGLGLVLVAGLRLAGQLASFAGVILFHPLGIAFGIAAGALCFILTVAGLGALWLSFAQGGGPAWRSYNWGSLRPKGPAGPDVPPPPAPAPAAPPPSSEAPRPVDGTSDAP